MTSGLSLQTGGRRRPEGTATDGILREANGGVSPVIATILLVAITVILAAVLYFMVSGLFNPHNTTAEFLGVNVGKSGDGLNWTLTVASMSKTFNQNDTSLTLLSTDGSTTLPFKTLAQLETATKGVEYIPAVYGPTAVSVGDRILISTATYPRGTQFQFLSNGIVLDTGTLQ